MSAIAGLYTYGNRHADAATTRHRLSQMNDRLAHRGADDSGQWVSDGGHIGLAHRMLWSTEESLQEKLPQGKGSYMLTADARIDNRVELIEQLAIAPSANQTITDSDLILAAYQKWGEDCPYHLLGDFAFALWDEQEHKLFCARDIMGVRPFLYHHQDEQFVFASEIKALFCLSEVPRRLNQSRIAQLLTRALDERDVTLYEEIYRLPAAHCLTVAPGVFKLRQYWQLDPEYELKLGSDAEYAAEYKRIFDEAVRCRMRSAFPIGSMLSGGLDSSSIACTARNELNQTQQETLHTFSTRFSQLPEEQKKLIDETYFVEKVLDQGGFTPHFIDGDQLNPLADYDELLDQADECFFAPNLYYNRAWYQRAQKHNVRVVLDGVDGDSTVSHGHTYMYELMNKGRWIAFLKETRAYSRLTGFAFKDVVWEWGLQSLIPQWLWRRYQDWQAKHHPKWQEIGLNADFANGLDLARTQILHSREKFDELPIKTARHAHWHSLHSGLIQYAIETADKVAIAHQVELRFPFCDRRLMEFCVALPPDQKFKGGWTRLIHRRGLQGVMPDELRSRISKANLGANTKPRLLNQAQDTLEYWVFENNEHLRPYVNLDQARKLYRSYQQDNLDEAGALAIYGMATLSMWLAREQQFQNSEHITKTVAAST